MKILSMYMCMMIHRSYAIYDYLLLRWPYFLKLLEVAPLGMFGCRCLKRAYHCRFLNEFCVAV